MNKDLIHQAIKKVLTKDQIIEKVSQPDDKLLSRDEILRKVKTLNESVREYKKQRLKTFFPASALKTLLNPKLQQRPRRETKRSSILSTTKDPLFLIESSDSNSSQSSVASLTSSSNSSSSNKDWTVFFPKIDLKLDSTTSEYLESKILFESLEKEFSDKLRFRIEKRSNLTLFPEESSLATLNGYRSYVKYCKEAYQNEELSFIRMFVKLSLDEISIQPTARSVSPDQVIEISQVKEIIDDSQQSTIFFIYLASDSDICIAIKPITSEDYQRWSSSSSSMSKLKGIIYKSKGDLPTRVIEDQAQLLRHRATMFHKGSLDTRILEDSDDVSLKTDPDASESIEVESEKSWDFDFERLDQEHVKVVESREQSFDSEDQNLRDEDKIRSLTALAAMGKVEGLVNLLTKGGLFLKYGRWGKPHTRHVLLTADLKYVEWWHLNENKASGKMLSVKIISIQRGRKTKNFNRFRKPELESRSFSLVCKQRTIDLEIAKDNKVPIEVWVLAFESLIKQQFRKDHVVRYITKQSTIQD